MGHDGASDFQLALCARIIAHCQARDWYGPEGESTTPRLIFDVDGNPREVTISHDWHLGFKFPPATETQLQETEEALGLPLPPMLRALYANVANGGFGPSYGIYGCVGGFTFGNDGRYQTIESSFEVAPERERIDLAELDTGTDPEWEMELSPGQWPAYFLDLAYDGCGIDYYMHAKTGRIYQLGANDVQEFILLPDGTHSVESGLSITRDALSLEEWLEAWLDRERLQDAQQ